MPLKALFYSVDEIVARFGRNTGLQLSDGDPTLRDRGKLDPNVRHIRACGLRTSLLIHATLPDRAWLAELNAAGLNDVAFPMDTTQERESRTSKVEQNALRVRCIEMALGLPRSVIFNTTASPGNLHAIDALTDFFIR